MKKLLAIFGLLFIVQTAHSAVNKTCEDKLVTIYGDTIVCTIMHITAKRVAYLACPSEANDYDNSDHQMSRFYIAKIISDRKIFQPKAKKIKEPKERDGPPKFMIPFFALGLITTSWMVFLIINWGLF